MIDGLKDPRASALLNGWQRGFPAEPRPFAAMAHAHGMEEADVITLLSDQLAQGRISRVGATVAPNTISASTLAAMSVPEDRVGEVAEFVTGQPGVNHNYLREHHWNLWFVATGPDRAHVDGVLDQIRAYTGLSVLDLPLLRAFNVDLGFSLLDGRRPHALQRKPDASRIREGDRAIIQGLLDGLDIVERPFASLATRIGRDELDVLRRVRDLRDAGVLSRIGIIIRHRAVGWRANAMVAWNVPEDRIAKVGPLLARQPGVTLCYERQPVSGIWPWRLFSMIHARSRTEAMDHLTRIRALPDFADVPHQVLFSLHCFRQTGALVTPRGAA